MRVLTVLTMLAWGMAGCGSADFECAHLKSTAGEPEGDQAYSVTAGRCADGIDKEVSCTAAEGGWDCVCLTDGAESGEVTDDEGFDALVRDTRSRDPLDEALLLVADDCGW